MTSTKLLSILAALVLSAGINLIHAQQKYSISGTITNNQNGEFLIGATVASISAGTGTVTNHYGFYSLSANSTDSISLVYSYIGYHPQFKKIKLDKNYTIDIQLNTSSYSIDEISINADQANRRNIERAEMGIIDIPLQEIKKIPAILGEPDILKLIQLMPGVQSGNEGTTGFYVRGGNADQNLVLLDEATVYNPNHLFGLFSTFNSRALNNVELIKGGFPAEYGGRLSSILDIKMKEGNHKKMEVQGGIGLISSQITVEGPIKSEKASFIISGRRTYLDLLVRPFLGKGNETKYHFYDLNGKVNWQISPKNRIYLSGFLGNDNARYKEAKGISYGILFENSAATLRWNHIFNQKVFSNTSFIYNTYLQNVSTIQDNFFAQTYSGISDLTGKYELQYFPNNKHKIKLGGLYTYHRFLSMKRSEALPSNNKIPDINLTQIPADFFSEYSLFINDEYKINKRITANFGLRMPGFISAKSNYRQLEPRATVKHGIDSTSSIKASYTVMNQFLHLIPSSTAALPTDIWIPSSELTKPQYSTQYAIGYYKNLFDSGLETSVELYYKTMDNQVLFKEGYNLNILSSADSGLVYGSGVSYGLELFLRKSRGRFTGWASYTLSRTDQQFNDLNFGEVFPFKYDRRHVLSVAGSYMLNEKWTLSAIFVLNSGAAYTLPTVRFNTYNSGSIFEGSYFLYEGRNNARMNPYHRLDISLSRKTNNTLFNKKYESEWVFALYNTYSRQNPYFVYFYVEPNSNEPRAKQVSLLPIIPSITYNFKF
jgi:hypothetical protein